MGPTWSFHASCRYSYEHAWNRRVTQATVPRSVFTSLCWEGTLPTSIRIGREVSRGWREPGSAWWCQAIEQVAMGRKLMHEKFHLIMRKNIFTAQVTLWSFPNLLILSFCDSLQNLVAQVPEAHWEGELLFLPLPKVKESVCIFLRASDPSYSSVSVLWWLWHIQKMWTQYLSSWAWNGGGFMS